MKVSFLFSTVLFTTFIVVQVLLSSCKKEELPCDGVAHTVLVMDFDATNATTRPYFIKEDRVRKSCWPVMRGQIRTSIVYTLYKHGPKDLQGKIQSWNDLLDRFQSSSDTIQIYIPRDIRHGSVVGDSIITLVGKSNRNPDYLLDLLHDWSVKYY